jgi:sporulation protein YlmC with PRC-barrel domain
LEKTDKPLTKDALVSMQVIDSKGRLLGKVKDVVFEVGKAGIALSIENDNGEIQTIQWEDVQGASDFIILKSQFRSASQMQTQQQTNQPLQKQKDAPLCPMCSKPLTWIPQYNRYYCYNDKKYF